jgi:hypothetical protein
MSTFEILFNGETYKIRRKNEANAIAEIAWRLSISTNEFRKTAQIRLVTQGATYDFRPVW